MTRGVFEDLTGKQFGLWQVVRCVPNTKPIRWECFCQCGIKRSVAGNSLRSGTSKSCGCTSPRNTTHGLRKHPLYTVWDKMIDRCYRSNSCDHFVDYGGRGIIVCNKWKNDFKIFYDWATSNGWKRGLYIDRIKNNKNYTPSNCRFVMSRKSSCNKRNTSKYGHNIYKEDNRFRVRFQIDGKTKSFGSFKTLKEATKARNEAVKEIDGV